MRFQVPQFIDIEDQIFGPLTWKQFLYVVGGAGGIYVFWHTLPVYIAVPLVAFWGAFSLALAFYKVNNRPFIFVLQAWFVYMFKTKLYVWQQPKPKPKETPKKQELIQPETPNKTLTESKLKEIAWGLDVLDMKHHSKK